MRSPLSKAPGVQRIVVLLLLSLAGCRPESDRVLEETFEQLYTIQPNTDLSIQNGDGAVLVYGSNINEIRVQATKKAYGRHAIERNCDRRFRAANLRFNQRQNSSEAPVGSF